MVLRNENDSESDHKIFLAIKEYKGATKKRMLQTVIPFTSKNFSYSRHSRIRG
jgi:hypothetical protein